MNSGKLVLTAELELLSPLHIGSGANDFTDLDIVKDSNGNPFITFTSFIGVVRHELKKSYEIPDDELNETFGFAVDENASGSKIIGSDFCLIEPEEDDDKKEIIKTRDGIKIDNKTGIVKEGAKYDYQIVDKGAKFSFYLEAQYSNESTQKKMRKYFSTIMKMIKENESVYDSLGLKIGAKTNNGLGKIKLNNEKLFDYNFSIIDDVIAWLKRKDKKDTISLIEPFERIQNDLIIDAYFDLKTSLIQRSYNENPNMPDASHMQSDKKDILVGSGTKGVITSRARKIVNTIWNKDDEQSKITFQDNLLGYVYDPDDKEDNRVDKNPKKAKLQIEERKLPGYIAELQTRIKIDRFTGGAINGALFDSMPLFNTKEMKDSTDLDNKTRITITVKDCKEAEAGLMLLVLKDLWTGNLAIGGEKGIGRGVFSGVFATIKFQEEEYELNEGLEDLHKLQKYVNALVKEAGGVK